MAAREWSEWHYVNVLGERAVLPPSPQHPTTHTGETRQAGPEDALQPAGHDRQDDVVEVVSQEQGDVEQTGPTLRVGAVRLGRGVEAGEEEIHPSGWDQLDDEPDLLVTLDAVRVRRVRGSALARTKDSPLS